VELRRVQLFPLLLAAEEPTYYGVRVAKFFEDRLEFGFVVAGSTNDDAPGQVRILTVGGVLLRRFMHRPCVTGF
jgi:hypothetical protein